MTVLLKQLHMTMAALSIAGFVLRGVWAWRAPSLLRRRPVKVLPHVIDTLLLASAIGLLFAYGWNPLDHAWLSAKIGLLLVYIALGLAALKTWFPGPVRAAAFVAAVAVFAWIVLIARAHQFVPFAGGAG